MADFTKIGLISFVGILGVVLGHAINIDKESLKQNGDIIHEILKLSKKIGKIDHKMGEMQKQINNLQTDIIGKSKKMKSEIKMIKENNEELKGEMKLNYERLEVKMKNITANLRTALGKILIQRCQHNHVQYIWNDAMYRLPLNVNGATVACTRRGWSVKWKGTSSLICTAPGVSAGRNCNKCDTWRLFVWKDGGLDLKQESDPLAPTKAGKSYGGHSLCKGEKYDLPECSSHWSYQKVIKPSPAFQCYPKLGLQFCGYGNIIHYTSVYMLGRVPFQTCLAKCKEHRENKGNEWNTCTWVNNGSMKCVVYKNGYNFDSGSDTLCYRFD